MKPLHQLEHWLLRPEARQNTGLYHVSDFRSLFPGMSPNAYRAVIHRAERRGLLERVCQGVYQFTGAPDASGRILFHAAALMRARHFNYISLETVLSDAGVISQVPMGWITLVSTGRTATVSCGRYGTIEFIHTERSMADIAGQLTYDHDCHLFRASVDLAVDDMRRFNRKATADLILPQEPTDEHL